MRNGSEFSKTKHADTLGDEVPEADPFENPLVHAQQQTNQWVKSNVELEYPR